MGPPRILDCTGVLVAGGRAQRMGGIPKGLLRVEGEPIAARSIRLFERLFGAALVVANDPAPYAALGARVVADAIAGKGAPGGLHAALQAAETGWIFTAACDMPFLDPDAIGWLAERRGDAAAVVVRRGGRFEPMHALWSRACLPTLDAMLREGDPSLQAFVRALPARIVEEEEWRAVDAAGRAFENANTLEDAARLGLTL